MSEQIGQPPTKTCIECSVELVLGDNWTDARKRQRKYLCRSCWNARDMFVNNKYIPKTHPLFKPGRYRGFTDAAFSSLANYDRSGEGEVYIIHNPSFPGWIKVGMAVDSQDRLKTYQTSSPYRDYEVVKSYKVPNRLEAEAKAHESLTVEGRGRRGEWFYMGTSVAVAELDKLFIIGEQLDLF